MSPFYLRKIQSSPRRSRAWIEFSLSQSGSTDATAARGHASLLLFLFAVNAVLYGRRLIFGRDRTAAFLTYLAPIRQDGSFRFLSRTIVEAIRRDLLLLAHEGSSITLIARRVGGCLSRRLFSVCGKFAPRVGTEPGSV